MLATSKLGWVVTAPQPLRCHPPSICIPINTKTYRLPQLTKPNPTQHERQNINRTQTHLTNKTAETQKKQTLTKRTTTMLPQPDPQTLSSNPHFAALWKDLTTTKIQRNGVSKSVALDAGTVKTRELLKQKRVEIAQREVLEDAVRHVAFGEEGLSGEVSDDLR